MEEGEGGGFTLSVHLKSPTKIRVSFVWTRSFLLRRDSM